MFNQIKKYFLALLEGITSPLLLCLLVLLECLLQGEACILENFMDFQTYKTGVLGGQWQTVEQLVFGVASMGAAVCAAHFLRAGKIRLVFMLGFLGLALELVVGFLEIKSRLVLIPMFLGCGGGMLLGTLFHTLMGSTLHQKNPMFAWSLIGLVYSLNYLFFAKISAHWGGSKIMVVGGILLLVFLVISIRKATSATQHWSSFPHAPSPRQSLNLKATLKEGILVGHLLPAPFWGYILVACSPLPTFLMEHLDHLHFSRSVFQDIEGWSTLISGGLVPLWALFTRSWAPRASFYIFALCQGLGIILVLGTQDVTLISTGVYISLFGSTALRFLCLSEATVFCHQNSTLHFAVVMAVFSMGDSLAWMISQPISQSLFDTWGGNAVSSFWAGISLLYIGFLFFKKQKNPSALPSRSSSIAPPNPGAASHETTH